MLDEGPLVTRHVEIGRRLYRSGESEYLIDGEICRLRDIHDLLMDSGLGVKAYAVIEQGKIGQILSSRDVQEILDPGFRLDGPLVLEVRQVSRDLQ